MAAGEAASDDRRLDELESLQVASRLGIAAPAHVVLDGPQDVAGALASLCPGGGRVVLKAIHADLVHKSETGAVRVLPADAGAVSEALVAIGAALRPLAPRFALFEYVEHDDGPGGELLLGLRTTDDVGPVVTVAPGGVHTELFARAGLEPLVVSPVLRDRLDAALDESAAVALLTGSRRGGRAGIDRALLRALIERCLDAATGESGADIAELEINPLVVADGRAVALDAVVRLHGTLPAEPARRPVEKLECLLRPRSIAVVGASRRLNPGHVIVRNVLRGGFPRDRVVVVKDGLDRFEGCRCVPDLASLDEPVDLCVLAVDAAQVPDLVQTIVDTGCAETVVVIPGGLGEADGTQERARRIEDVIAAARTRPDGGPLVNGGNCLGIRSRPGRADTLFIPEDRFAPGEGAPAPLAIVSQSGAFMVAKSSKLAELDPRYLISVGNQIDLTVGDYLTALADDEGVRVVACYIEGFRPGDGAAWLAAAARMTAEGRSVVLYRAGRTPVGAAASASHSASIAGDYGVTRALAARAGVMVARTLEDFEELTRLACQLADRPLAGRRLAAMSNAGFECVAMADHADGFELATLGDATAERVRGIFERRRLAGIVGVRNPLDVTPIADDDAFAEIAAAVLADDGVDLAVFGCVPHTPALGTVPVATVDGAPVFDPASVARRLAALRRRSAKPFIAVVDGGPLYDPLAELLDASGVPVFRNADRAMRMLSAWAATRPLSPTPADAADRPRGSGS